MLLTERKIEIIAPKESKVMALKKEGQVFDYRNNHM